MMFESVPPTRQRLLLFARLPEHGHVKSRLAAALGADTALAIYRAMLRDILATLRPPWPDTEVEVLWTSANGADGASLKEAFDGFSLSMQAGRSLGDRLAVAFSERFFFHRTEKIIAIGVDDPTLPRPLMERAFALLDSCDWVIGPATDGGYYLIGCRNESFDAEVFAGIEWGTASVFGATTSRIGARNNTLAVLPPRSDIDLPADLEEFAREERGSALGELLR
ncbi:MAG TPA: TIGR04282 family arsenosugar biosynthesis glycosyltransferase, partial [Thermoanaerobaculia bacterium]|nr:TIGR04282 family arsenosugar biosynthesis glycosyltransferase [Thermoanaerobaculia bacterium]